ncbi:MAG: hypothetical protein PUG10_09390 [Lachnospiraceae bacterium]|nr:hypothetical protein [Lachnospiraceae bacterium]
MAKNKILTIEDLIKFCRTNKMYSFSYKESGMPIVVQSIQDFSSADIEESDDGKLYCKVRVCHTLLNRNKSFISEESMKQAMPTLKYSPLLAKIHQLDDGTWDFHAHDCHMEQDENGNEFVVYDEQQIGTFTADEPYLEYDEKMDKTYVVARVVIPEEYTRAADIIRSKNGTKVSCELIIYECSYNAKEKYLQLDNFRFNGCACLGCEKDGTPIGEGMLGSKLTLEDFSEDNNSLVKFSNQLIEMQAKLSELEARFNIENDNSGKEETRVEMNENFDEVTETEKVTETEETTEEEVTVTENESEETVDETSEDETVEIEGETTEVKEDNACGGSTKKKKKCEEDEPKEESDEDEPEVKEDNACGGGGSTKKKKKNNSVEPMIRTYEISHDDIRCALYNLLASYEESDNDWYFITGVYDSYFVYESWNGGKIYGQKYTKDNDNVAFDGERYSLHKEYLTDSEYAELQSMRSNYSSIVEELNTYKSAEVYADKMTVFDDEAYADYLETDEFKALMSDESVNQYSKEELAEKADATLGKLVKKNRSFSYSENNEKKSNKVNFNLKPDVQKKSKAYGTLFK